MKRYSEGDIALVYNLGDQKEYRVIVHGIVNSFGSKQGDTFYIVEFIDRYRSIDEYPYTCTVITDACLKAISGSNH